MKIDCASLYGSSCFTFPHHHDVTRGVFSPYARNLHELGELLRRAGQAAGLTVRSEFKVTSTHKTNRRGKVDWIWKRGDEVVAAFEIEGQDVEDGQNKGIDKDRQTLSAPEVARAPLRAILFFQVDHDGTCKDRVGGRTAGLSTAEILTRARKRNSDLARTWQLPSAIEVAWDQDLCARPDGQRTLLQQWIADRL